MISDRSEAVFVDPSEEPAHYPGRPPESSSLLIDGTLLTVEPLMNRRLGQARVVVKGAVPSFLNAYRGKHVPLNAALLLANAAPIERRFPLLAVGSNASPGQMCGKFNRAGASLVLPMIRATVVGLSVSHSAHVSTPGYVPMTPVPDPRPDGSQLFVLWLDQSQLELLDETEPNYDRLLIDTNEITVRLEGSQERLSTCVVYVSRHGVLLDERGQPVTEQTQEVLITRLLARSPALSDIAGDDATRFLKATSAKEADGLRSAVASHFSEAGWVGHVPIPSVAGKAATYGLARSQIERERDKDLLVVPTPDDLQRSGKQWIRVSASVYRDLGLGSHALVASAHCNREHREHHDDCALGPFALVRVAPSKIHSDTIEVDQVIRNAIGVEIGERVCALPARRWSSKVVDGAVRRDVVSHLMLRVQTADPAIVERECCLMDELSLDQLGIESGDWVVLEGVTQNDGFVRSVKVRALRAPDWIIERRRELHGGGFDGRYPDSMHALGVYPDLPWIFIDRATRSALGLVGQSLGVVRAHAALGRQILKEFTALLLLLLVAALGAIAIFDDLLTVALVVSALLALAFLLTVMKIAGRVRQRARKSLFRKFG